MVQSPGASFQQCLFVNNTAQVIDSAAVVDYACGGGHGGALCIFGTSRSVVDVQASLFINNTATYGGGLSLHADSTCTQQQLSTGCFTASFDARCNFTGNSAHGGAGGAMYWTQAGNLNMSCNVSRLVPLPVAGFRAAIMGVADVELPCSNWGSNQVTGTGYGPVIASSSFFLQPEAVDLSYYTSNQPLPLTVVMQVSACLKKFWCGSFTGKCRVLFEKKFQAHFIVEFGAMSGRSGSIFDALRG